MNMFKPTEAKNPDEYIEQIAEPRKSEIVALDKMIRKLAPELDRMMYHSVIGYGSAHYRSKSGREGVWFKVGLASQKNYISVYLCALEDGEYIAEKNKDKFPKASIGKSCIRFKKVEDIDLEVLVKLIKQAAKSEGLGVAG